MSRLIELYENILKSAGLTADENGFISSQFKTEAVPLFVKGKRLTLPRQEVLMRLNNDTQVVFHPLYENIMRGESDVLAQFRKVLNLRLNTTASAIAVKLLTIIESVGEHAKLTPEQSELLTKVTLPDEKMLDSLIAILQDKDFLLPSNCIVHMYLNRGGSVGERKYSRACVVSFPLFNKLNDPESPLVKKLRKKDVRGFKELLSYIFPSIEDKSYYSKGSDSLVAPFMDCLMASYAQVASKLNDILDTYKNMFEDYDSLYIASDWIDGMKNLESFDAEIRFIPMQKGNEGETTATQQATTQLPNYAQALRTQAPPQQMAPVQTVQPQTPMQQPTQQGKSLSLKEVLYGTQPQVYQTPQPVQQPNPFQPQGYPTGYPQQTYQGFYQPPMQQPVAWGTNPQPMPQQVNPFMPQFNNGYPNQFTNPINVNPFAR